MILTPADERWKRLEEYARFKCHKFRLHMLPLDLQVQIVQYLTFSDLNHLLAAVLGFIPNLGRKDHVMMVPPLIRMHWFEQACLSHFVHHILQLSDHCHYLARDSTSAKLMLNWSPFSQQPPCPIAEFFWDRACPVRANTRFDTNDLMKTIRTSFQNKTPVVLLCVHLHLRWGNMDILSNDAVLRQSFTLFPPFIVDE